ncbi:MAG: hypothetical protein Q4G69_03600 [Planctomycetia bacterium]|nr:hypothetical protein [Planctomycetia bacterium]
MFKDLEGKAAKDDLREMNELVDKIRAALQSMNFEQLDSLVDELENMIYYIFLMDEKSE